MNDKKLECLVEGYEGTYYEVGQVWETRDGAKVTLKGFSVDEDYPLLFDVGYRDLEEFTLKGTFYEDIGHRFDLIKLISTEVLTEVSPSEPKQKTFSEYLKENKAYESFIENCVEDFLNDIDDYHEMKLESDIIYLGNAFNWRGTEQGNDYWYNLHNNQPYDLIYDMNEIIFAEVDRRIAEQKVEPNFMTTEKFDRVIQEFMTKKEFNQMLGRKSPKRYMLFVEGKSSPKKIHTDLETAEEEAKRLATREIGSKVFLVEIVKEYKSRLEIDEL